MSIKVGGDRGTQREYRAIPKSPSRAPPSKTTLSGSSGTPTRDWHSLPSISSRGSVASRVGARSSDDAASRLACECTPNVGWVARALDRFAERELETTVESLAWQHDLTRTERTRLEMSLRDVETAKEKEYWEMRGPMETWSIVVRALTVAALTFVFGLAAPPAVLFPATVGAGVAVAGRIAVLWKRLSHALRGRAAVEIERIVADRILREPRSRSPKSRSPSQQISPLNQRGIKRSWLGQALDQISKRVLEKYLARYPLDERREAVLREKVREISIFKEEELWGARLKVEIGAIAATTLTTASVGALLGLLGPPGLTILAISGCAGALLSTVFSFLKFSSALEGTAYAAVGDRACAAEAIARVDEVTARYAKEYCLDDASRAQLSELLTTVARLKEKEVWEKRLLPTIASPLARGTGVALAAWAFGVVSPEIGAGILIASAIEATASVVLLFKKLDQALEGAAHASIRRFRSQAPSQPSQPARSNVKV